MRAKVNKEYSQFKSNQVYLHNNDTKDIYILKIILRFCMVKIKTCLILRIIRIICLLKIIKSLRIIRNIEILMILTNIAY